MALNLPESQAEVLSRMRTDAQAVLPNVDPFIRASLFNAELTAQAGRHFENSIQLGIVNRETFLPSAQFLESIQLWANLKAIELLAANVASGFITISGVDSTIIPLNTLLATEAGTQYETLAEATILDQTISVSSITRVGSTATVTTVSNHNLASNISMTISGADQTEYNIAASIVVTGLDEFTYQVTGSPSTPATGTILAAFTTASVEVESLESGEDKNQASGVALNFVTPIPGADSTGFVQFGEIVGGSDIESNDSLKSRTLEVFQNPISFYNVAFYEQESKKVSGVTRVFVQPVTPAAGQVTIFFTRDDDDNIIPSAQEVQDVKDQLLLTQPAFMDEDDLIVKAPTPIFVGFTFSSLTPNTLTMQQAITNNLTQFFREQTSVGKILREAEYNAAIVNTIDLETGDVLEDFVLSAPIGDIVILSNQLPVLNTITF